MEDRRKGGRRHEDLVSAQEAAEKAAEALDRIAIIAMEQGSITRMKEYIGQVISGSSRVGELVSDLLNTLDNQDLQAARTIARKIGHVMEELKGLESRVFDMPPTSKT